MLTDLANPSLPQLSNLAITCLTNGQYDININDYACLSKFDFEWYTLKYNSFVVFSETNKLKITSEHENIVYY